MRKIILVIIFICTIISSGCSNKAETSSSYIKEKDAQYMYMRTDGERYITAGDNGYYFINGLYLYYCDYESMEPIVLCNKANCLHDKEMDTTKKYNCNGFVLVGFNPLLLTVNEEYIYCYIDHDFTKEGKPQAELIRISLDGSTRETVTNLEENIASMALHRDKLYYSTTKPYINKNNEDEGIYEYTIKELNIKKQTSEPKEILSGSGVMAGIQAIIPIGNKLTYIQYEAEDGEFTTKNHVFDLNKNKIEAIGGDLKIEGIGSTSMLGNKVIFIDRDKDKEDKENYVYEYDLEKNQSNKLFEMKLDDKLFYSDDKYIYVDNTKYFSDNNENVSERSLQVYNKNGEMIDVIDISEVEDCFLFNGGDSRYLFVKGDDPEKAYIKYIDKQEIGSGNVQLKTLFELEAKYLDMSVSG